MAGLSWLPRGRPHWAGVFVIAFPVLVNVIGIKVACCSLGLGPAGAPGLVGGTWWRGLRWALAAIGAVAVVFAVGAAVPLTRSAFRDSRYHFGWGHAALTAFVLIPVGTVLFEEVAFRGVLWGLLRRRHSP